MLKPHLCFKVGHRTLNLSISLGSDLFARSFKMNNFSIELSLAATKGLRHPQTQENIREALTTGKIYGQLE